MSTKLNTDIKAIELTQAELNAVTGGFTLLKTVRHELWQAASGQD
jgi:hypothetical protein